MIKIDCGKDINQYDYKVDSLDKLHELMDVIYKPIIGAYVVVFDVSRMRDAKTVLQYRSKYNHLDLILHMPEKVYKELLLASPNLSDLRKGSSPFEYLKDGITSRLLLIETRAVSKLYASIGHSTEEIDDALDLLESKFGTGIYIRIDDIAKHISISDVVYPRTVVLAYISKLRWRKSLLTKCLSTINKDVVLAAMIKNLKALHKAKSEYLRTGVGQEYIKKLNTRNLNMLYYTFCVWKPYNFNDVVVLLEIYEECKYDLLFQRAPT